MRVAHRGVGGERPFPARAVRAVRAVGQDGRAIRTGQLRSMRPRLARSRVGSRLHRDSLDSALRGRRLTAPRVTDRPRLIGWSSLRLARPDLGHPSSSSRAPPRRFQDRPEAGVTRVALRHAREPFHPWDQDRRAASPCGSTAPRVGMPSVVSRRIGSSPTLERAPRFPFENAGHAFAHRSHLEAAAPRVSADAECSSASAAPPDLPFGSPDGADARCVGSTSAISPSPYPYPRLVDSGPVDRIRGPAPGLRLISRQGGSLRRVCT